MKKLKKVLLMCFFALFFCAVGPVAAHAGTSSNCLVNGAENANFSNVVVFVYFDDADAEYLQSTWSQYSTQTCQEKYIEDYSGSSLYSLSSYLNAISYGQLCVQNVFPQYNGTTIVPYKITSVTKENAEAGFGKDMIVNEVMSNLDAITGVDLDLYEKDGYIDNLQVVLIQNDDSQFTSVHYYYGGGALNWSGKYVTHVNVLGTNALNSSNAGVVSHEFLHTIGFPDLYNNNYDYPVLTWDQMASASMKQSYPLAYLRSVVGGWFDISTITDSATGLELDNQENENGTHAYILQSPLNTNEIFVVEMRKRDRTVGEEHLDYFAAVADSSMSNNAGIIVYRVKKNVEGLSNYHGDTAVYVFRPSSVDGNTSPMICVQNAALNAESGRTGIGSADMSATLADGALTFSDGTNSGIVISNVSSGSGDSMTFDVTFPEVDSENLWSSTEISATNDYFATSFANWKNTAYMATYNSGEITLYAEEDGNWTNQGNSLTGLSDFNAMNLVVCGDDLYLVYNTYDTGLFIKKWSDTGWSDVAAYAGSTSNFDAAAIDGSLYITYIDGDYPTYNAKLLKLDGTTLNNLGTYQTGFLGQPRICAYGENIALAVRNASNELYLYRYTNGQFVQIDNEIIANYFDIASVAGKLYVVAGVSNSSATLYVYENGWNAISVSDTFTDAFLEVQGSKLYLAGAYSGDDATHTRVYCLSADNTLPKVGENISAVANSFAYANEKLYVGAITISGASRSLTVHTLAVTASADPETPHVHDYQSPSFAWSEDGKCCKVTYTCTSDASHTVTYDCTVKSAVKTAATCTSKGTTIYTATYGTDSETKEIEDIAALGHTVVTDAAVAATCTTAGKTEGSHCSVCNTVLVEQQTVAAKGHTAVTDAAVAATCTTAGKTEGSHCSVCNTVLVEQKTVAATGHTVVTDPAVAATCTTAGKTEGSHCSVCNTVLVEQKTVAATGHTVVTDAAVAATCTTAGKTEGSHCSVCNTVLVAQETVVAKGHTAVTDKAVAATCTTTGLTEGSHCSVCGAVIKAQDIIPALGHKEKAVTIYKAGYKITSTCENCGDVISKEPATSVMQDENGTWCYYVDSVFQEDYTGFADNRYGTWYIKDGKVAWGTGGSKPTSGTIIYGTVNGKSAWYLVCNAKVTYATTVASNSNGWWYVNNGVVDFSYTGIKNNDYGWWRIVKGKVDFSCNTVEQNEYGWWKLKGGKVDFSCNTVERNANGWWKLKGGKVDFSYTGVANNASGWWRIEKGKVNFGFTGIASNEYGSWYCKGGKVQFGYTGKVTYNGKTYTVKGGKVQ